MSHIIFNLRALSHRLQVARLSRVRHSPTVLEHCTLLSFAVPRTLIAKGLLLALLGTMGMPVSAQPPQAPTGVQAQDASKTKTVAERLLGRWQAKDPTSEEAFTFIFAPNGNLFVVLPAPDGSSVALKVAYQINSTTQPMQLDIQLSAEQKALTIFEFTADGKLRLELDGLTPGLPRPTEFKSKATLFEKTSEVATVPENIQVIDLSAFKDSEEPRVQKPEDEAKKYMYALTQVQQAHYQELGKFAREIEEVSIGLRTETESYRYQIVPQEDDTQSVMITAVAKDSKLPSYTGVVFVTKVNGEATTLTLICETHKPSTSPPTMPAAPTDGSLKIQCPAGSRSLQ